MVKNILLIKQVLLLLFFDEITDKNITRSYILNQFRDIIKDKNDVEEIKYYQGRKVIKNYKYPKGCSSTDELMGRLLNTQNLN